MLGHVVYLKLPLLLAAFALGPYRKSGRITARVPPHADAQPFARAQRLEEQSGQIEMKLLRSWRF